MRKAQLKEGGTYMIKGSRNIFRLLDLDPGGAAHKMECAFREWRSDCREEFDYVPVENGIVRYVTSGQIREPADIAQRTEMIVRLERSQTALRKIDSELRAKHFKDRRDVDNDLLHVLEDIGRGVVAGRTLKSMKADIDKGRHLTERRAEIRIEIEAATDERKALESDVRELKKALYECE